MIGGGLSVSSKKYLLQLEFLDTVGTDILALKVDDILGIITENAGGLVLFQYNRGPVHINLKRIFLCNV